MKRLLLIATHLLALGLGFALGIYALPLLIAPQAPSAAELQALMGPTLWTGRFRRDLKDSDALHWGEGTVSIGPRSIRKLPRQVDSSEVETSALNTLGRNTAGGTLPRDSWGRHSL
ncbi:hypothetical protein [Aquabacterium humicola]|uniref:hypothetical protein n=1 Tax=Aquabacterium humicola TaxID=3237377 RepID=UPI002542E614|nr:hypothetical protein [Rubrivivax pictus]